MVFFLVAVAAFAGTLIAVLLWQAVGRKGQIELIEEASRKAAAHMLTQIRAEFRTNDGATMRDAVDRIEESGVRVEAASAVVAHDLDESHKRADAVLRTDADHGEAADAASRSADSD